MHYGLEINPMNIRQEPNIFEVLVARVRGQMFKWKTLNKVDRQSLLDTDEKPKVMRKQLQLMTTIMGQELIQLVKLKGLTTEQNQTRIILYDKR